jgi:hypothetical protein
MAESKAGHLEGDIRRAEGRASVVQVKRGLERLRSEVRSTSILMQPASSSHLEDLIISPVLIPHSGSSKTNLNIYTASFI